MRTSKKVCVLLLFLALFMMSCATIPEAKKWEESNFPSLHPRSVSINPSSKIKGRIAVLCPEEGRYNMPDEEIQKDWGYPFSPQRLILGLAIFRELQYVNIFEDVHWDPIFYEDYDFIIRSRILTPICYSKYPRTPPAIMDIWVYAQDGRVLDFQRIKQGTKKFCLAYSFDTVGRRKEAIEVLYSLMEQVIPWIFGTIQKELGNIVDIDANRHALRYYESLDPELNSFRKELESRSKKTRSAAQDPITQHLVRAYVLKTAVLESLRQIESATEEQAQRLKLDHADKLFENTNQALKKIRKEEIKKSILEGISLTAYAATTAAAEYARISDSPELQLLMEQMSNIVLQTTAQLLDPTKLQIYQSQMTQAVVEQDREILRYFRNIRGTATEVRDKWLDKYMDKTPALEDVLEGRWPPVTRMELEKATVRAREKQGGIVVKSNIPSGEIYINDQFFGHTPSRELMFPIGAQLKIVVSKEGYLPYKKTIKIVSENIIELMAELTKIK